MIKQLYIITYYVQRQSWNIISEMILIKVPDTYIIINTYIIIITLVKS